MPMISSTLWVAIFFVLALSSTLPCAELAASEKPENVNTRTLLASLGERAIPAAPDKTSTRKIHEARMRALLHEGFDLKVLARAVVGEHWQKLDEGQREDFVELFEDAIVQQTLTAFSRYRGEGGITGVGADSTHTKPIEISMDVMRSNGALLAKVNWRIRLGRKDFTIIDIVVEGESLTLRQESGATIESSQGKVDDLSEALR